MADRFSGEEEPFQPGLKVFTDRGDPQMNAFFLGLDPTELYIEGYRIGAQILLKHIRETGLDQDFLVFPIAFHYRHYLELRLKEIITLARMLDEREGRQEVEGHNLRALWRDARPLIEKVWPEPHASQEDLLELKEELDAIQDCVDQITDIDARAQTFRYPRTLQGKRSLPAEWQHLNLGALAEAIEQIGGRLDQMAYGLGASFELQEEFEREYGQP